MNWKTTIKLLDERRDIAPQRDVTEMIHFSARHFFAIAKESIERHGFFSVALSGGSTPKPIYEFISHADESKQIDWKKVRLFWSDERCVSPDNPESNYHMTMTSGFDTLPIKPENIHRMHAEEDLETASLDYENVMKNQLHHGRFDLVILGMGDDGHTASLFPHTHGLHAVGRQVIGNYIPQKNTWRMTLTYEAINAARHIVFYVTGANKADILTKVLLGPSEPDKYPSQKVGTPSTKALWITDHAACADLVRKLS